MIDFPALLRALADAGVEYIVVGGAAAAAHGSARLTLDLDVVYRRTPDNMARAVNSVASHHPYLRGAPPGLPFRWDVETIRHGLKRQFVKPGGLYSRTCRSYSLASTRTCRLFTSRLSAVTSASSYTSAVATMNRSARSLWPSRRASL